MPTSGNSFFDRFYLLWSRTRPCHVWAWAAINLSILAFGFIARPFSVDANLMSILPDFSADRALSAAEKQVSDLSSGAFNVLVGDVDFDRARLCAEELAKAVASDKAVESILVRVDGSAFSSFSAYAFENRYRLLSDDSLHLLETGRAEEIAAAALREAYSPLSIGSLERVDADPFLLAPGYLRSALGTVLAGGLSLAPRDGVLAVEGGGKWYVLVTGHLRGASLSTERSESFVPTLRAAGRAIQARNSGLELIYSGVPFHTYESSRSAQAEIAAISAVATFLILALVVLFFMSLIPLAGTLLSLFVGVATALAATNLIFGQVHLFTLVFGTSLVGNAVDFALLFFAEWKNPTESGQGPAVMRRVLSQITLGLATTLVSYFALCYAPFPLIRQMAVFSSVGLVAAYLTELLLFGGLPLPRAGARPLPLGFAKAVLGGYDRLWDAPVAIRALIFGVILAATIVGLASLHMNNDIRSLYSMSKELADSETKASELLGLSGGAQYFMVRGGSADEVLTREEALVARLSREIGAGKLEACKATSMILPSLERQARSYRLVGEKLMPLAGRQLAAFGIEGAAAGALRADFAAAAKKDIVPEAFFKESFSVLAKNLWIGPVKGEYFSMVFLLGVKDPARMRALEREFVGIRFIDMVADISAVLGQYSVMALLLLLAAYAITIMGLWPIYGLRASVALVAAPLLASAIAVATLSLAGLSFNLFAILGLILILGTGVDYAIFYYCGLEKPEVPAIGTFLAMATTFVSYLALAFCSFPPARVFGLILSVGTAGSYLLAPIAARWGSSRKG
jgi:predicted exporter